MSKQHKAQEQTTPKSERPAGGELDEKELKKVSGGYQTGGSAHGAGGGAGKA